MLLNIPRLFTKGHLLVLLTTWTFSARSSKILWFVTFAHILTLDCVSRAVLCRCWSERTMQECMQVHVHLCSGVIDQIMVYIRYSALLDERDCVNWMVALSDLSVRVNHEVAISLAVIDYTPPWVLMRWVLLLAMFSVILIRCSKLWI